MPGWFGLTGAVSRRPGVVVVASAGRRASTASRRVEHRKQFFDYLSLLLLL
ncbi:MAG: hypothetical protein NTW21_27840 [Verrucomicrobia bacterium]|nr:hypothetical protein [Verrucomicrobiota bacterium]